MFHNVIIDTVKIEYTKISWKSKFYNLFDELLSFIAIFCINTHNYYEFLSSTSLQEKVGLSCRSILDVVANIIKYVACCYQLFSMVFDKQFFFEDLMFS